MPIIQINWPKIKDRLGDVTAFYALTHRQAGLLLSLTEQLDWEKTFRVPDYDGEDKDNLDWEISDTRNNLAMPVNLGDLFGYIDDIEQLLRTIRDRDMCCGNTVPLPPETYDSPNFEEFPNGTPPETWGDDEAVADLDDWKDLVCGAAHDWVDLLKTTNEELDEVLSIGVAGVGFIAGLLGFAVTVGIGAPIAYALAVAITSNLVALGTTVIFDGIPQALEDARADILCSIMQGGPEEMADAVEAAVGAGTWLVWYQFIDYENVYSVLLDGTNGEGTLTANRGASCECEEPAPEGEYCPNYHWRADASEWILAGDWAYQDLEGSYDGFDIDGILRPVTTEFPTNHWDCKSEPFDWPGGRVDVVVRVKCANSGDPVRRRTSAVVRFVRASDDAILDSYGWTLEGDSDEWVEGSHTSDTTVHPEGEYYITLAIDGYDGYGGRDCDRISIRVHGT